MSITERPPHRFALPTDPVRPKPIAQPAHRCPAASPAPTQLIIVGAVGWPPGKQRSHHPHRETVGLPGRFISPCCLLFSGLRCYLRLFLTIPTPRHALAPLRNLCSNCLPWPVGLETLEPFHSTYNHSSHEMPQAPARARPAASCSAKPPHIVHMAVICQKSKHRSIPPTDWPDECRIALTTIKLMMMTMTATHADQRNANYC